MSLDETYKFLRTRWETQNLPLFAKNANAISILIMVICVPIDLLSFPLEESYKVIQARMIASGILLLCLYALVIAKQRPQPPSNSFYHTITSTAGLVINFLYLYFLLSMDPTYRLSVTTGCISAIFGAHLFLYRLRATYYTFMGTYLTALLIAYTFSTAEWRHYLLSLIIGHVSCYALMYFFRKLFYKQLKQDYVIKIQHDAIKQQSKDLEQAVKDKETLLHVMIHDISNPLSIIMGHHTMLASKGGEQFDPKTFDKLKKVHKAANSIGSIIKHVREFEAINSGKKKLELVPCSINEAIDQSLLIVDNKVSKKAIKISYVKEDSLQDAFCLADQVSLVHQVFVNLLTNAIKFSTEGAEIIIRVKVVKDKVQVSVQDFGVGIPPQILENLFNQNKPTTRRGTAGEPGTGFGMPIVKAYIEHFDGEILVDTVTEDQGKGRTGTTFTVCLQHVALPMQRVVNQ